MRLDRNREVLAITVWSIACNLVLVFVKGIVGWMANSRALMADSIESLSDLVGTIVTLIGIRAASLPPDRDHPYGHGKAESIASIIVSVLIMVFGAEVLIRSIQNMQHGVNEPPQIWALLAVALTLFLKETLFRIQYHIGKKHNSQALMTHAWEHRSDVYSSVAVFLGISGSWLGKVFGISWMYWLDSIAGCVVSFIIINMGYRLVMEAIHNTMDHVMHPEESRDLIQAVRCVPGVIDVDDLRAREHGHYVIVDVKISVNPHISVQEGHDIAKQSKQRLLETFPYVSDVFIHVNPYGPSYPYKTDKLEKSDFPGMLH